MNRIILALLSVFSISAMATSPDPCTPTREMKPTIMFCPGRQNGGLYYTIQINILASPNIEECQGENYYEYKTADIKVFNDQGLVKKLSIGPDFNYTLTPPGINEGQFDSDADDLHLKGCGIPANGGAISLGN